MSFFERSERLAAQLPDLLVEIAAPSVPDYTDDVLAVTAGIRQRPRWTFLERWLPMILVRKRFLAPAVPWRALTALLAILAILAAGLLIVGSRPHLPPPFGPARNGAIVFDQGGDIYLRDTLDGTSRRIVNGSGGDFAAGFTRNGRHITFLRRTAGTEGSPDERLDAFIANLDGTDPVDVTGPLIAPNWSDLAPDDSNLVIQAADPTQSDILGDDVRSKLYVADIGSPGSVHAMNLPLVAETVPNFRGPDGAEIVFRGVAMVNNLMMSGLFAVHPDGTGLRPLTPTDGDVTDGYQQPMPSADGRYVTYTVWQKAAGILLLHVVDLTTGQDRVIDGHGDSLGYAAFSPDGSRLLFTRFVGSTDQVMLMPTDGTDALTAGPAYRQFNGAYLAASFSPDGRLIVINDAASKETRIVDAATGGNGQLLAWSPNGFSWQRLAP